MMKLIVSFVNSIYLHKTLTVWFRKLWMEMRVVWRKRRSTKRFLIQYRQSHGLFLLGKVIKEGDSNIEFIKAFSNEEAIVHKMWKHDAK